jgi:sugar phosphate isomerase/epimerase
MEGEQAVPSFGVVTHAVGHDPMPFATCLQRIAAAGGEHILLLTRPNGPVIRAGEPAAAQFPNVVDSDPDELKRVVAAAGLRISSLLPGVPNAVSSDSAVEETRRALDPYLARAVQLGCTALCISAPRVAAPGLALHDKQADLRRLARLMDSLADGAGGRLTIAVDVHFHSLVETVDDCRYLVEAQAEQRAGLLLNVGHLTTAGQEGWTLVEQYPDRIHVVGWKDHSLAEDRPSPVYSIELGTGDTPFERYIRAFKSRAVQASGAGRVHLVNVEHPPTGEEVPTLTRSIAYIKRLWAATPAGGMG